jgi:hypothetical protein
MPGLLGRTAGVIVRAIGGIFVGTLAGLIPGVIIGCLGASRTELGYGQIIFFAGVILGSSVGAVIGLLVVVVRMIMKKDELKETVKGQGEKWPLDRE